MNRLAQSKRDGKLLGHILAASESFWGTIALYAIATGILTWQGLGQVNTALIGQNSSFTLWSLWLPSRTLWLNQDMMVTDYAIFPFKQNLLLVLSPLGSVLYGLLSNLRLSPPLAFNLLYGVSIIFTGWATAAYLLHLRVPRILALFAGLLLIFSPIMYYRLSQGHPDLMALGWVPLGCFVWEQVRLRQRHGVWLTVVWIGTVLTNLPLTFLAVVVWVPYIAVGILQTRRDERRKLIDHLLVQALVLLAVFMVYPLPGLLKTWVGLAPPAEAISLRVVWQPTAGMLLSGILWGVLVVLSILSLWQVSRLEAIANRTTPLIWLGIGLLSLVFTMVPVGTGSFSNHQQWLSPVDWLSLASVAFCMFIALSLASFWRQGELRDRLTIVLTTIPVAVLAVAIALQTAPPIIAWNASPAYAAISKEAGDYAVLEVPFGIRSLTTGQQFGSGFDLQQYAVIHRRRTLNGSMAGSGTDAFNTYSSSPLFRYLAGEGLMSDSIAAELETLIKSKQIGYLVVQLTRLRSDQQAQILDFFDTKSSSLCRVFRDSSTVVYRTTWHPFNCNQPLM
jgi:hypothetical protein